MANTWKKGNFGLAALSDINVSFDSLIQHFNDNTDGNFADNTNRCYFNSYNRSK